jgi:hypothetical protein
MGKFNKYNKSNFKPQGLIALVIFFGLVIILVIYFIKRCFLTSSNYLSSNQKNTNESSSNPDELNTPRISRSLAEINKLKDLRKIEKLEKLGKNMKLNYEGLSGIIKNKNKKKAHNN